MVARSPPANNNGAQREISTIPAMICFCRQLCWDRALLLGTTPEQLLLEGRVQVVSSSIVPRKRGQGLTLRASASARECVNASGEAARSRALVDAGAYRMHTARIRQPSAVCKERSAARQAPCMAGAAGAPKRLAPPFEAELPSEDCRDDSGVSGRGVEGRAGNAWPGIRPESASGRSAMSPRTPPWWIPSRVTPSSVLGFSWLLYWSTCGTACITAAAVYSCTLEEAPELATGASTASGAGLDGSGATSVGS